MALTIHHVGVVPSVQRFVDTNWLLRHILVLGFLVVFSLSSSIVTYILVTHYGGRTQFAASDPRIGWEPAPKGRDTMDIISSCLSTLITCIYSSVHFDVPRSTVHRESFLRKLRTRDYWLELWVKVSFWVLGVFSPEMLVLHAFYEHMIARRDVRWMRAHGHAEWSMTLAFYADMGGFQAEEQREDHVVVHDVRSGYEIHEILFRNNEPGVIKCQDLEYDIADRTKADLLFKILTTLQICRFGLGTLVRWIVKLPIAPLETITCAYVLCTLVYYVLWFQKPYNVNERIVVKIDKTLQRARPVSVTTLPKQEQKQHGQFVTALKTMWDKLEPDMNETDRLHGSTHLYQTSPCMSETTLSFEQGCMTDHSSGIDLTHGSLVAASASLFVGLAHLACWGVEFPNSNGKILWQYCTILLVALPLWVFFIILGAAIIQKNWVTVVMNQIALTSIVVYCIARIILLILLGQSFESLPAQVYDTGNISWLDLIPFIH